MKQAAVWTGQNGTLETGGGSILLETGGHLLLETGGYFLTEDEQAIPKHATLYSAPTRTASYYTDADTRSTLGTARRLENGTARIMENGTPRTLEDSQANPKPPTTWSAL